MSTTHPGLDITDEREPEELTMREMQENDLVEYRINTMSLTEVCEAATNWLLLTLLRKNDEEIAEMHKDFFDREIH